ncbi:MAG: 30S ribosomal protein S17 [Anaerolineae bacterium]|nr:30S ribosomal protein S17 [Anaerolineae bacterium]
MANSRRRLTGQVISNKMQKTVIVRIDRSYRHRLYGKVVRDSKKYMAHDENGECQMGDVVVIVESRPLSRHKRWVVQSIVREDASARTPEIAEVAAMADEAGITEVSEPPEEN